MRGPFPDHPNIFTFLDDIIVTSKTLSNLTTGGGGSPTQRWYQDRMNKEGWSQEGYLSIEPLARAI